MANVPYLSLLMLMPALGVALILLIRGDRETVHANARKVGLFFSLVTFFLSLGMWYAFDATREGYQFVERHTHDMLPVSYYFGVDGISLFLILLSTLLIPICLLASWESIQIRVKEYVISFLLLDLMLVGVFSALDIYIFYVFFEAILIPMFILIGVWGGERRIYAAFKFFLYTLLGSVLFLIAVIYMAKQGDTTSIPDLASFSFPRRTQTWLWLAFFASFAIKVPMFPVHTWLPDAHVEAPTAASVILAGVLLKLGGYGFLRFSLPMLPAASVQFAPLIYTLSIIAIIYASLVALVQKDMKKLVAYSSVAHMGFVTLGIFTFTEQGLQGAMVQMLSHGIVSAALFLCVGVVYDRMHTREIEQFGGLVNRMPAYAFVFFIFILGSLAFPGTSGFVGEFLVLLGAFEVNTWVSLLAASGMVLGATYALVLYRRVIFGKMIHPALATIKDLNPREIGIFVPLVALVLWMGIYPKTFTKVIGPAIKSLTTDHKNAGVFTIGDAGRQS